MKQRRRIYYSSEQRNLMWDRWQKGDSMRVIAGLFDRGHSSVQRILSEAGGIRPRQRCRSRLTLTLLEREEISRGVVSGQSIRCIALLLGRAPSTVSREIKRNGGRFRLPGHDWFEVDDTWLRIFATCHCHCFLRE